MAGEEEEGEEGEVSQEGLHVRRILVWTRMASLVPPPHQPSSGNFPVLLLNCFASLSLFCFPFLNCLSAVIIHFLLSRFSSLTLTRQRLSWSFSLTLSLSFPRPTPSIFLFLFVSPFPAFSASLPYFSFSLSFFILLFSLFPPQPFTVLPTRHLSSSPSFPLFSPPSPPPLPALALHLGT